MDKRYKVNEIFYSLQGEGFYTGTPAVFLRLSGCNRDCVFCDTDHADGRMMNASEIVADVSRFPARHLVLTGGEPTLQADDPLIDALKEAGFYIQIETNGTNPVPSAVDWVTCSPKTGPWNIDRVDELKVVYLDDPEFPLSMAERFVAVHLFLQPCSGENTESTVEFILAHPEWRLSLQTHKLISIK